VFFGALRVKIHEEGLARNKAVYLAIGVRCSATRRCWGLWIAQTDGAELWVWIMNELRARGLNDTLVAAIDGSKEFPEASPRTVGRRDSVCRDLSLTPATRES